MESHKRILILVDFCAKQLGRVYRRCARMVQASKDEEYPLRIFRSKHNPSREVHTRIMRWVDNFVYYLASAESPFSSQPLIVGTQVPPLGKDLILYNSEQMTRQAAFLELKGRFELGDIVEIWDYSKVNVGILKTKGFPVRWVPYRIDSKRSRRLFDYAKQPKIYDVGFCGSTNSRRLDILSQLEDRGLKVLIIDNLSGDARDRLMGQCRIILNIHAGDEYSVFESIRCEPWIHVNIPVVSENSLDNDERCINLNYNQIVPGVCQIIDDLRFGRPVNFLLNSIG
jgi:hypothetical protein